MKKILAVPVRVYNNGSIAMNGGSIQWQKDVRKLLLYWPRVVIPQVVDNEFHNTVQTFDPNALSYLKGEGQIENIILETRSGDANLVAGIADRTREFIGAMTSWNTSFAIFQHSGEPDSQADYIRNLVGIDTTREASAVSVQLSLMNMLPMAPPSATLQDIVDFKRKRAAEFTRFRSMLDSLSYNFSAPGDLEEGARLAANEVRSALVDLDRLTLEKWPNRVLDSITTSFGNFSKNVNGVWPPPFSEP